MLITLKYLNSYKQYFRELKDTKRHWFGSIPGLLAAKSDTLPMSHGNEIKFYSYFFFFVCFFTSVLGALSDRCMHKSADNNCVFSFE